MDREAWHADSRGRLESDMTERLNWTDRNKMSTKEWMDIKSAEWTFL